MRSQYWIEDSFLVLYEIETVCQNFLTINSCLLTMLTTSVECVVCYITEHVAEDTECSEFRYFSCLLQTGLTDVLFNNYDVNQLFYGNWTFIPPLCMYVDTKFFFLYNISIPLHIVLHRI